MESKRGAATGKRKDFAREWKRSCDYSHTFHIRSADLARRKTRVSSNFPTIAIHVSCPCPSTNTTAGRPSLACKESRGSEQEESGWVGKGVRDRAIVQARCDARRAVNLVHGMPVAPLRRFPLPFLVRSFPPLLFLNSPSLSISFVACSSDLPSSETFHLSQLQNV